MRLVNFIHGFKEWLHPRLCLLGAVAGVVLCSFAGRQMAQRHYMKNFTRFGHWLSATGNYFPTVSQMVAIARAECREDQIAVIVGGNSIFNGWGQPADKLWTDALQQKLGGGYRVFNFALIGNENVPDGAALAAQSLQKSHRRVIYVSNVPPACQVAQWFHYMPWDAGYKGLVDASVVEAIHHARVRVGASGPFPDRELGMRLDAVFYAQDLWNYVAYEHFFTAWTSGQETFNVMPRREAVFLAPKRLDPDYCPPQTPLQEREKRWRKEELPKVISFVKLGLDYSTFRAYQEMFARGENGSWTPQPAFWQSFQNEVQQAFPQEFRPHVLAVFTPECPWLTEHVRAELGELQDPGKRVTQERITHLKAAGYQTHNIERLDSEDFYDWRHFEPAGGAKVAAALAPQIAQMAKDLGFFDSSTQAPATPPQ